MTFKNRLQSVDVMRVVAIVAVIVIHTVPFADQPALVGNSLDAATAANQVARFAVPFFFVMSGYFWAHKIEADRGVYAPTVKMAKRIFALLIAWSFIYLLPTNVIRSFALGHFGPIKQLYWNVMAVGVRPFTVALQGTKVHLWFLPALICGQMISALLIRYRQQRLLAGLAISLYLIGIAGKAYSDTPLGFHSEFNFRNGPFFSLIFYVTGYLLKQCQVGPAWLPTGILIAVLGMLMQFSELVILNSYWGINMAQDYVIGTYFYGLGVAIIALSGSRYLNLERAASIGPLVLGIYLSHFVFVDLLEPIAGRFAVGAIWSVIYIVAVLVLSYALVRVMARFALTRRFVM